MQFLAATMIIIGATIGTILAMLAVLAIWQGWREAGTVELLGSDAAGQSRDLERHADEFTE
jgi:hypothetical protein